MSVGAGFLIGGIYTAIDLVLDRAVGVDVPRTASAVDIFHALIDLVLPALIGALVGAVVHLNRMRGKMAVLERQRAEELAGQIHKIERDQAVWVISASLLHELKTPLHALGLLLDEIAELPEGSSREREVLLKRARAQSERLEHRVMALRSMEHARPPEMPEVELLECVEEISGPFLVLAQKQSSHIEVRGSPQVVRIHPNYLRIVLGNLLENALDSLRRRNADGRIEISVCEGGRVRVTDNGAGLTSADREHIFEPLYSRKDSGLGLGLSIARGLCRSMGGDLTVLAESDGAGFEVQLQKAEP